MRTSRLTPEQIADIKLRAARGDKQAQIGRVYGIRGSYVSMIVRGLRPLGVGRPAVQRHFAVDGGQKIVIPANVDPAVLAWLGHDLIRLAREAQPPTATEPEVAAPRATHDLRSTS